MADEKWTAARLIPTSGITGPEEQERRGTSALLAVLVSVREFGRAITARLGAHPGTVETFIEVPFDLAGRTVIPDGLIRVTRGTRVWVALVEVKTGKNALQTQQIENYLDVAREQGFDAVLTISNEIPTAIGVHPTPIDKRKCKKAALHHLSWSQIHTEAIMQRVNRAVSDPDQAWILNELIRYLEHPKSGAVDFDDMGTAWVKVREAISAGTLRASDQGVSDVVAKWEQLVRYAGMRLGRQLGVVVEPVLSRKELSEPAIRLQQLVASIVSGGRLQGALRVPNTVGNLQIDADLRAGKVSASVSIDAPREGRPLTRINWLVRQLAEAPDDLRIDAYTPWSRGASTSELLRTVRAKPEVLLDDQKREIRSFTLTLSKPAGSKRGQGKGSFVASVLDLIDIFYAGVMQTLKGWSPAPRKLPVPETETEPALELVDSRLPGDSQPSTPNPVVPDQVLRGELPDASERVVLDLGDDVPLLGGEIEDQPARDPDTTSPAL